MEYDVQEHRSRVASRHISRAAQEGVAGRVTLEERALYRRWIAANGLAEAAGLGTTFVLGHAVAPSLERLTGLAAILGSALAAVALGTLLEGVLIGFAQERVLRGRIVGLRPAAWTIATAIGAGAAWTLGTAPSTVMALGAAQAPGGAVPEPGPLVQLGLAAVLGLVAGPVLGVAQWTVLRGVVTRSADWLWANALAWGVGMPLIFLGMDRVPWVGAPAARTSAIYAVCAATGLAVGAIHGLVLVRLLRRAEESEDDGPT